MHSMAQPYFQVDGYASVDNGGEFTDTVFDFNQVVKEAVATAFAEAVASTHFTVCRL